MQNQIKLFNHQLKAVDQLKTGSILNGGVGSGKTLTALSYYKKYESKRDLYVITTAKKRDSNDWTNEAELIGITNIQVDSWNNISKYVDVKEAFFIFDEQRVVGYGAWTKSFIKITDRNPWIILSATPGDTWMDYIPVFIANNFYKNKTDFINQHVEYDRFVKFPKVKKFHNVKKLEAQRESLLIDMLVERHTTRHRKYIYSDYNINDYNRIFKDRWNIYEDKPIENVSELMVCLRKVVSMDASRFNKAAFIMRVVPKIIVFYNYTYELDMLRLICDTGQLNYSEWNGEKHQPIPDTNEWVYLVQYTAGAEGWNCTDTDTVMFYSPNYSYRIIEQCEGRIDRITTPYLDLEYIYLQSKSPIDNAVMQAIKRKKKFNERKWVGSRWPAS